MSSGGGSSGQIIGYRYYMSIHMGIGRGPINTLKQIKVGDKVAWTGAVSDNVGFSINEPKLFGGDEKEGGIVGNIGPLMGAADQVVPAIVTDNLPGLVPGWRGTTSLFYYGLISSNSPYPKPWKFQVVRTTAGWDMVPDITFRTEKCEIVITVSDTVSVRAMNPAHIIFECATNRAWGRGLPLSFIDMDSFVAAADTLYDEKFGLCLRWTREDDIDKFIQSIINHVGGVIYIDRITGLLTFKLIRFDYVADDLPTFDFNSGLIDIVEDESSSADNLYNEVIVRWHNNDTDEDGQVRAQNLASIQSLGTIISTSVDYLGIPTFDLATRVAQRDLQVQSSELRRMVVKLDRRGFGIPPGGVFRISAPSRGIENIVLRAGDIVDGPLTDGTITITAVQDVFTLPETRLVGIEESRWEPPIAAATIITDRRIEEFTYRDIVLNFTEAEVAAADVNSGVIKTLAKAPNGSSIEYAISSAVAFEAFVERGTSAWDLSFPLSSSIGHYDTSITFTAGLSLIEIGNAVEVGSAVLIDDEYMRLDAVDFTLGTGTVARGVGDTVPAPHSLGARLWFEDAQPGSDGREYASGEEVYVKLLTRTSSSQLAEASAPTDTIEIGARQGRPYPPGDFRINGTPFANVTSAAPGADVVFTWTHRDRVLQSHLLFEHGAGSSGPEAGVTYTVRVYDDVTLLRTVTGISGTTWSYTNAMYIADGSISELTFELESVRGAYVSWQKYRWTIFVDDIALLPGLFTETYTFYAPIVLRGVVLSPSLFTDSDTFYSPTVTGGSVSLLPGLFTDTDTFYALTITAGSASLLPGLLTDSDTFYAPAAITLLTLQPGLLTETDTFYAPLVSVPFIDKWSNTFAPAKFTLSNGDMTATTININQVDTILSIFSHATGKKYFEITAGSGANLAWGLADATQNNSSQLWLNGVALRQTGNWRIGATETASGSGGVASATLGFAVDFDLGYIIFRRTATPGTWFGNNSSAADPADIATNGFSISGITGVDFFLAFTSNQNGATQASTINAGATAFAASAPTGYDPWNTIPVLRPSLLTDSDIFYAPTISTSARGSLRIFVSSARR